MEACETRPGVQGVVLDAALFQLNSGGNNAHLEKLLHRLYYSHIRVGILFRNSLTGNANNVELERIEKCMPLKHSCDTRKSTDDCLDKVLNDFRKAWKLSEAQCLFVTLSLVECLTSELTFQGWHVCLLTEKSSSGVDLDNTVNHIQELYSQVASINKQACQDVTIVGYSMKWSREMDFLKRGALPLNINCKNLSFLPINLELALPEQFKTVNVMLHKPTDEITSADLGATGSLQDQIRFTDAMQRSSKFLSNYPQICVVDPIERILPLVDRAMTQEILQGLSSMEHPGSTRIRAPRYRRVLRFDKVVPSEVLRDCGFSLPAIIKPQIACGVSDAHIMAVVFKEEGFLNLAVPAPCTMQEYIDHGSTLYKFYVIGEGLFYSVRKSTPNAAKLMESSSNPNIPAVIMFDSLKSLPKHFVKDEDSMFCSPTPSQEVERLDLPLVSAAATWLRQKLKLTIFGFDVVIELATNDHVIIDMNFFPTFKDVDEQKAIVAFWDALLRSYALHKKAEVAALSPYGGGAP